MPSGTERDLAALEPRLLQWLQARHPDGTDLHVEQLRHAAAGLTNETVLLDWSSAGAGSESLVLRLPAEQVTFPGFDLAVEAQVQEAVARAGVPAPVPAVVELDEQWIGAPFLAMPFVKGHVGPQAPAFDPWIQSLTDEQQRRVHDSFIDVLARVHTIDAVDAGLDRVLRGAGRTVADEVSWWEDYVQWAAGDPPDPILVQLLAWCRANVPTREPAPSLLWGDPRLGNAIFGADEGVVAALDWDMAFVGPPEHDVGWYFGLDGVMEAIAQKHVPGFPARSDALADYEARIGRRVVDVEWYEVFALVRSIAITVRQIHIAAEAGVEYLVPPPDRSPVVPHVRELIAKIG